jgi:hypothetical protein
VKRRGERASVLIEALVAVPVCIACAVAVADCGVLVRDRLATTQATTRAARAELAGGDAEAAARAALPTTLRASLRVSIVDGVVDVRTTSHPKLLALPGGVAQHSRAVTRAGGAR